MVLKVHSIIRKAARTADIIAIAGDRNHPEMDSHLGVAGDKGYLVHSIEDVRKMPAAKRIAVVAQTTFEVELFKEIIKEMQSKAEVLDVTDTICRSTSHRQSEVHELAADHDTFVVIGGRTSANTGRLAEIAAQEDRHVIRVENADQLKGIDTSEMERVAIIAGASTPQWVIEDCIETLQAVHAGSGLKNAAINSLARGSLLPAVGSSGLAFGTMAICRASYHFDVLLAVFLLALACTSPTNMRRSRIKWFIAGTLAVILTATACSIKCALLAAGIALLRILADHSSLDEYIKSIIAMLVFMAISLILPLSASGTIRICPASGLLVAFITVFYLGGRVMIGLKNMERDAIEGNLSLARFIGEKRAIALLEYAIMLLAVALFLSFPLKLAPALIYGLLPPLFMLAKGIDLYNDNVFFDNRAYQLYIQSIWPILTGIMLLWLLG